MQGSLHFLADESCDFAVVRALRAAGFNVAAVSELAGASDDDQVIALATAQRRVLLTEDKDFGQLVFAANRESGGVILIRFPSAKRSVLGKRVLEVVNREGERLRSAFTVIQPARVRISKLPL